MELLKLGNCLNVLINIFVRSPVPGPNSTILNFLGLPNISHVDINHIPIISENKFETTGAVINTNSNAFARRRAQMALQIEKENKIEQLEKDVAELKKLIKGLSK